MEAVDGSLWKGLGELGWTDGQTTQIDYGWWEGHIDRAAEIATDFAHRNVDAIIANADAGPAVKKATTTIPIVFVLSQDPVGSGLVSNLAPRMATLQDFRSNQPIWPASASNCCRRWCPTCGG